MSNSIYAIAPYGGELFNKHDIVVSAGSYYYSLRDGNQGNSLAIAGNVWWGGLVVDSFGVTRPNFLWRPSYSSNVTQNPKVNLVKFGDSYEQRVKQFINNNLLEFDLAFDNRDINEATAIIHFLSTRQGVESFNWVLPPPYTSSKLFICRGWTSQFTFYNNYSIKMKAEEVVN